MSTVAPAMNIMSALQLDMMTVPEQEKTLIALSDLVFRGTLLRVVEKMDDKTREEFSTLLEKDASPEEVQTFLMERVPEADQAAGEVLADKFPRSLRLHDPAVGKVPLRRMTRSELLREMCPLRSMLTMKYISLAFPMANEDEVHWHCHVLLLWGGVQSASVVADTRNRVNEWAKRVKPKQTSPMIHFQHDL